MTGLLLVVQVPNPRDVRLVSVIFCPLACSLLRRSYVQNVVRVVFDNKVGDWSPLGLSFGPSLYINDCHEFSPLRGRNAAAGSTRLRLCPAVSMDIGQAPINQR